MSIKKYTDPRAWLRALLRTSVHAGTDALLSVFGTNAVATMLPSQADIAMNLKQAAFVFLVAAAMRSIKFINEQTVDEDTTPPMTKPN
jgi:hypothetical protein